MSCLKKGKDIPNSSSLRTFPIFLANDGLIRLKGRLSKVNDDEFNHDSRNPIILDHRHPICQLIINHYHCQNSHMGHETVIVNLRKKYWITRCRNALKKIVRHCQYCRNAKAKPQVPVIGQLPSC